MNTTGSQSTAFSSHRAVWRAMWAFAALFALSYSGDGRVVHSFASAQETPVEPTFSERLLTTDPLPNTEATATDGSPAAGPANQDAETNPAPKADGKKIPAKDSLNTILARRGTLILRDATLADWMFAINQTWRVDVMFDPTELQRYPVDGTFTDRPLEEVLNAILAPKGLTYRKVANGLSILKQDETGVDLQQKNEIIQLRHNKPEEIEPTLRFLLSPKGKTQSVPSAMAIMVIDLPENIDQIRRYVTALEQMTEDRIEKEQEALRLQRQAELQATQPNGAAGAPGDAATTVDQSISTVLRPQYVSAVDIQEAIQSQIADGIATAIDSENSLVIVGSESAARAATQLMQDLDRPRRQVKISVIMYDVSVDSLESLGFNWRNAGKDRISTTGVPSTLFDVHTAPMQMSGAATSAATTATSSTTTAATTTAAGPFGSLLTSAAPALVGSSVNMYHATRYFDVSAVLQALQQTDGARLLASPTVLVYDRQESQIRIVSEIPVQQLTQTDAGGNIGTTTFREAGITMLVEPRIANDKWLRLTVSPEFSALRGFQSTGQPIIDRRQATTDVLMMTGDTLVLGGLRRQNEIETVSGIPGLMNIKYLGNLFRAHRTTVTESELIIFVQAEIVNEDFKMDCRQGMALQVATETLDNLPPASHEPFIPPCNDPYCPYHNPHLRRAHLMTGPVECTQTEPLKEGEQPLQYDKFDPNEPYSDERSPMRQPEAPQEREGEVLPRSQEVEPNESDAEGPPPVTIDQTAMRLRHNRMATRRLPSVDQETAPALPRQNQNLAAGIPRAPQNKGAAASRQPIGANPKARLAQAPSRQRPAETAKPAPATAGKKTSWFGELLR